MELYTTTPLGKAILKAFSELNEDISEKLGEDTPGSCKAYVFGGAALHIFTNARGSSDIDVEIEAAERLTVDEIVISYIDEESNEQFVEIDPNFSTGISGTLSEDYRETAIPLMVGPTDTLHVFLVSPINLAVHKLDRLAADDQNDIISLAKAGKITASELHEVGTEVVSYSIGSEERLKSNLKFMVNKLEEMGYE